MVPWKDRLEPGDLAVTDSIGTDPDDPRMEEGFRKTQDAETSDDTEDKPSVADETVQEPAMEETARMSLRRRTFRRIPNSL